MLPANKKSSSKASETDNQQDTSRHIYMNWRFQFMTPSKEGHYKKTFSNHSAVMDRPNRPRLGTETS